MTWTAERLATVEKLWAGGATGSEAAALLGVTRNTILGLVHRKGWLRDAEEIKLSGADKATGLIARMTPEELDEFKRIYATGLSLNRMAKHFEMAKSSVHWLAKALKLPARDMRVAMRIWHEDKGTWRGGTESKKLRGTPRVRLPRPMHVDLPAPTCEPVRLVDARPGQCTWIAGEPMGPATLYCGEKTVVGSWCAYHAQLGCCEGSRFERLALRKAQSVPLSQCS